MAHENPFQPPGSVGGESDAVPTLPEAEKICLTYLSHEQDLGCTGFFVMLAGVIGAMAATYVLLAASGLWGERFFGDLPYRVAFIVGVVGLLPSIAVGVSGIGLARIQPWARTTLIILVGLPTLLYAIGQVALVTLAVQAGNFAMTGQMGMGALVTLFFPILLLYTLLDANNKELFSSNYRKVIEQTPHIRPRSGFIWVVLAVMGTSLTNSWIRVWFASAD